MVAWRYETTLHVQHTVFVLFGFCLCFARLQLVTRRRFIEEMLHVFLFTFYSSDAHFHLGGCYSISPILQQRYRILSEIGLRCFFISCSSSFFVIHVNRVDV